MKLANEIWKFVRDIASFVVGLFILLKLSNGDVPEAIAPLMLGAAAGLAGVPLYLRSDERKKRNGNDE